MKRILGLAILWTLACLAGNLYAADTTPIKAQVAEVSGRVTYSELGGPPRSLRAGTELPSGAVVRTGEGAAVEMSFGKNATLRLTQNSVLGLDKLETGTAREGKTMDIEMTLFQGSTLGNMAKLFPESKFEVKLSSGVVSVREGQYRISAEGFLVLLKGNMLFAYVPTTGEPTLYTLTAPPAVYYSPTEKALRPAPSELIREVQNQITAPLRRR